MQTHELLHLAVSAKQGWAVGQQAERLLKLAAQHDAEAVYYELDECNEAAVRFIAQTLSDIRPLLSDTSVVDTVLSAIADYDADARCDENFASQIRKGD